MIHYLRDHLLVTTLSLALILGMMFVTGCSDHKATNTSSGLPTRTPASFGADPPPVTAHPAGATQSVHVITGVLPMGSVPYDGMMLPLISPDGRFVATQTGAPPTWSTMLAEAEADLPIATRIDIYQLDWREGIPGRERMPPLLLASVAEPVVLGRSCDVEGFLIESPRDNGARWIGKVAWRSGEITWLVTSPADSVNAFAALGPQGRLAWSRRSIDNETFELVVRSHAQSEASEWTFGSLSEQWLMPTWSGRADGLFVFNLTNGNLDVRYGRANSVAALRQSMQRLAIATESSIFTAYQSMTGQPLAIDGALPTREQIVFYHPAAQRMAVWRPLAPPDRQGIYLNARSVAALVDEEDFAFISTDRGLLRQHLRNPLERIELSEGTQIPRQITNALWPFVLLGPVEGHINVMGLRLAPREEAIFAPRQSATR